MPVTYIISFNGQSATVSKKAAQIISTCIDALVGYDAEALKVLEGKVPGVPPLIGPCQAGALLIQAQVTRNRDAAKMLTPKEAKFTLAKPTGAVKADEE